jgi:predicted nucleic acid-binding protein
MAGKTDVLLDTSVLINFARIGRIGLLAAHPAYAFFVTDHVRGEVRKHYVRQREAVEAAIAEGAVTELRADRAEELEDFGRLMALKTLGAGECSAIAVAKRRSMTLAIDDKQARRRAKSFSSGIALLSTEALVISLIQERILSVEAADEMKQDWERNHRFKLGFGSFSEKL